MGFRFVLCGLRGFARTRGLTGILWFGGRRCGLLRSTKFDEKMESWEQHLGRWETAGVVDEATGQRIRAFEAEQVSPGRQRWQVVVALILGGILLGAGVLLFVAAHWNEVSPSGRFLLVVGVLAALHLGAVLSGERFPAMATVLHGVGTAGAGAAIALVGQIFNMQEHWPAAILMWALCAAAGWRFLGDQFQQVLFLLLVPAWIICEWSYWASNFGGFEVYLARMIAVVAAVYLTAFIHSKREVVFGILFGVAGVALIVAVGIESDGWSSWYAHPALPGSLRVAAIAVMSATIAVGWMWERRSVIPAAAVTAMMFVLPWLRAKVHGEEAWQRGYTYEVPSLLAYAVVAATAMVFVWWAVRERSRAVVNFGIAAFAITVGWFYFSSLMDKLGRSLGLIGLGILFLLGGWLLERFRRRLMEQVRSGPSAEATA